GEGDWTPGSRWATERLVTFETDLSGLLDDAILQGVRHGASAGSWCGPSAWDPSYNSARCQNLTLADPTAVTTTFTLDAGASHYVNYRIEISDHYTGDLLLANEACASGEPGNGLDPIRTCASVSHD